MAEYTQDNRPMRISTALGPDALLLTRFSGQEGVSRPFIFQLDLISEQPSIDGKALLRTPATLTIDLKDGGERHINGLVRRFSQLGSDGAVSRYRIELVPWLWFLSLSRDCKIFQNKTVLQILEDVFKSQGYTDFEIRCTGTYEKREYCVQYRETHLNFVSRLMEDEGIFYFFEHKNGKHTLVLADSNNTVAACSTPFARVAVHEFGSEDVIKEMEAAHSVYIGKVTLGEHDYLQPSLTLRRSMDGNGKEEVYDYMPVGFNKLDHGDRYARIQLEAEEAMQQTIRGQSTCRFLASGFKLDVKEHYRADVNQTYLLLEVKHSAAEQEYRTSDSVEFDYQNDFVAIPIGVPFRPPRQAEKPTVLGSQMAVVVGKKGEEIWVDSHGRVKVQFPWDRDGKKDENSSCWVRVSSGWAGKAWGMVSLPRIGQEVLIDFIEGDPDRPVIVGRLYNAEQTPPYALPDNGTQSGIKSRSSKGGGTEDFNEIRFEDKKGSEEFYEHAQKDMKVVVENDRTEEVGKNESVKIGQDRAHEVKGQQTLKVGKDESGQVGGSRTTSVGKDDSLKVGNNLTVNVTKDIAVKSSTGKMAVEALQDIGLKSGTGKITVEALQEIELKVGASTVKIGPAGIELKAPQVKVQGMAIVELKGPMVTAQADAIMQVKGPMTQVNADAMLLLRGAVTMIN